MRTRTPPVRTISIYTATLIYTSWQTYARRHRRKQAPALIHGPISISYIFRNTDNRGPRSDSLSRSQRCINGQYKETTRRALASSSESSFGPKNLYDIGTILIDFWKRKYTRQLVAFARSSVSPLHRACRAAPWTPLRADVLSLTLPWAPLFRAGWAALCAPFGPVESRRAYYTVKKTALTTAPAPIEQTSHDITVVSIRESRIQLWGHLNRETHASATAVALLNWKSALVRATKNSQLKPLAFQIKM